MRNPFETADRLWAEPPAVVIGTFTAWNRSLSFDSTLYSTKYLLRRDGGATHTVDGVVIDGGWTYEIVGAASAAWAAGDYVWDLVLVRLSDSAESIIESGSLSVFAASADRRDHAQIMVDKINSILEGRADSDVSSYMIKSRSITKMSISELMDWRNYYLAEIGRRPNANGGKNNTVLVRFT